MVVFPGTASRTNVPFLHADKRSPIVIYAVESFEATDLKEYIYKMHTLTSDCAGEQADLILRFFACAITYVFLFVCLFFASSG